MRTFVFLNSRVKRRSLPVSRKALALILIGIIAAFGVIALAFYLDEATRLYNDGQRLTKEGNYEAALQKYRTLAEKYPDNSKVEYGGIDLLLGDCYFQWGQTLQNQRNYAEAVEKYLLVNSTKYTWIWGKARDEAIPECYYQWVCQLIAAKQYAEAAEKYSIISENCSSTIWASPEKALVFGDLPEDVLFNLAKQLQQEGSYTGALRLYEILLQNNPTSQFASEAEKAKIDIVLAQIAEGEHGSLPQAQFKNVGELGGKAELTVVNDTPYKMTILLSGPEAKSITIEASSGSYEYWIPPSSEDPPQYANRAIIALDPGEYKMAAQVDKPTVTSYYGQTFLSEDCRYQDWLYIKTSFG